MSSDTRFKECYYELSSLWNNYPIVDDYRKTLMGEKGYESWIWNEYIDLFISNNYSFCDEQEKIIEKYYGENWDVTTEFPEWCNMCFGGYLWEDFLNDDEYSRAVKLMG